jgi:multicomponent Na+:H+ antiporter subunit A
MTGSGLLLVSTLAVPLAMLTACLSRHLRKHMPALLALAPLPGLAAALFGADGSSVVLPRALLGMTFTLDRAGAMLLGAASLLWIAAGAFVRGCPRSAPDDGRFAIWWLMTLTGSLGVFIVADLVGFYLFFTLGSLAAYGLVADDNTVSAWRAGAIYVAFALLGEAFLLMGFVLLAASDGSLLIRDAVAAMSTSPWRNSALALLVLGFGVKIGLVPLHVWMPLAYSSAPIPAAAVLSGAAVKAGVIGLIRFLPFEAGSAAWGGALAAVGFFSAFYAVAIGITQQNPKTVLAYSSVSQMGFLAAVLGMGLAAGDTSTSVSAAFYALHHVLVKGGLFLAIGVMAFTESRMAWRVLLPAALLALGLGGLPLTGGGLAKFAVKAQLGDGLAEMLAALSAIGTTLLMFHFLRCLMRHAVHVRTTTAPRELTWPWLAVAVASVVVPWALYPAVANTAWHDALTTKMLWEAFWPVAIGGLLALALQRQLHRLPRVPEGDILAADRIVARAARRLGAAADRIDASLCQWPVAGALFLTVAIVLAGAMTIGR